METQGKHFDLVFREIVTYFRQLETTPFCPADIFPREGARSYRRMGIIAIIFLRQPPPCPFTGNVEEIDGLKGKVKGLGTCFSLMSFCE